MRLVASGFLTAVVLLVLVSLPFGLLGSAGLIIDTVLRRTILQT